MATTGFQGHVEDGFAPVGRLFAALLRSPARGGGSLVVRFQDRVLVDIWGGLADPVARRPWTHCERQAGDHGRATPWRWGRPAPLGALYVPGIDTIFRGPVPRVLDTEMPAANGMFTAESLAALYGALAGGGVLDGRRLLSAETARNLRRVQTRALLPRAFGHYGYAGSGAWGDPDTGMSVAFVTNHLSPVSAPLGDLQIMRLSRAAVICARRTGPSAPM